jgi:hypothetical protein
MSIEAALLANAGVGKSYTKKKKKRWSVDSSNS